MDLAQRRGDADREAQEAPEVHGRAEQPIERLAARVLEHQHGPAVFAHELQRPYRPGAIELVFQFVFMGEAVESGGRRALPRRQHNQHSPPFAVGARAPSSAEDPIANVPQDVEALIHRR